jgi:c-di-GMP-binding flagellar brake protein YcgR
VPTTPQVHCLVTVTDQLGRQYRSRIEDVGDGVLVLARPLDLPVEHEFGIGAAVLVSWSDQAGVVEVDTELLDSQLPGRLGFWLVRELGPYRVQQRRQYVRVSVPGLARLSLLDAESGQPGPSRTARLMHVSEAALRCALPNEQAVDIGLGAQVMVEFGMAGSQFQLAASVLKLEPARHKDGVLELVLMFQADENESATLRRLVFAEQLRQRDEARARANLAR